MYLNINNSTYMVTSECNKPYLKIDSNNMLPLTTLSGGGQFKCKVGTSYSTSTEYLTTAEVSDGLSSTTALTRESTSGESYLTNTISNQIILYMTDQDTSSTLAVNKAGTRMPTYTIYEFDRINKSYENIQLTSLNNTADRLSIGAVFRATEYRSLSRYGGSLSTYSYTSASNVNSTFSYLLTKSTNSNTFNTVIFVDDYGYPAYGSNSYNINTDNNIINFTSFKTISYSKINNPLSYYYSSVSKTIVSADSRGSITVTTGTSYLTTKSTYGYSGYSSSSTSGGITTYRPLICKITSDTYYTSAIDSSGLSDVTVLTRESTSSTGYINSTSENWYVSANTFQGANSTTELIYYGQNYTFTSTSCYNNARIDLKGCNTARYTRYHSETRVDGFKTTFSSTSTTAGGNRTLMYIQPPVSDMASPYPQTYSGYQTTIDGYSYYATLSSVSTNVTTTFSRYISSFMTINQSTTNQYASSMSSYQSLSTITTAFNSLISVQYNTYTIYSNQLMSYVTSSWSSCSSNSMTYRSGSNSNSTVNVNTYEVKIVVSSKSSTSTINTLNGGTTAGYSTVVQDSSAIKYTYINNRSIENNDYLSSAYQFLSYVGSYISITSSFVMKTTDLTRESTYGYSGISSSASYSWE